MKKKKVGVIASSVAAIAVCSSMVVGSTFALFTSEDTVNIAVTSGKVAITASVEKGESTSTLGDKTALGGFSSTGLALENIAPGDIHNFTVKAENKSTISVKYRTTIEFTNALLASALDVTVDGVTYSGLTKYTTAWEEVDGDIDDIDVTVTFPALEESQNKFQDLKTDIVVKVEGVQANAKVSDADREFVFSVNNATQLEEVVTTVKELEQKATINLIDDIALTEELYIDQLAADLTINGNGHKITAADNFKMNLEGQFNLVKINDAVAQYGENNTIVGYDIKIHKNIITLEDVVLEHKALEGIDNSYHTLDVYGAENVVLNNVTLVRDFALAKGGAALVINGSEVVATDLHIVSGGSAWGGINVDAKNGAAKLTLKSGFSANVENCLAVWCENGGQVADEENVLMHISETSFAVPAAQIGEVRYATLEAALEALEDGDTLNIVNAGNFGALKIEKANVTVNGLLGADKEHSAVFAGLVAAAENVTFNDMYVEYGANYDNGYSTKTGVTYNHCTFVGNGANTALYVHVRELAITNCTFENWNSALYTCGDNHAANKIILDGNTFINVNSPFDGYWGAEADTSVEYNIQFTNNTIINDNGVSNVQLWDYTQWLNSTTDTKQGESRQGSAVRALVSGNTGVFNLYLTHFDSLWATTENCTFELTDGQNKIYRSFVAFEGIDNYDNYEIRNADGSVLTTYNAMTKINKAHSGMKGCYACCTGDFILVNLTTGEEYAFSVTNPVLGEIQIVDIG